MKRQASRSAFCVYFTIFHFLIPVVLSFISFFSNKRAASPFVCGGHDLDPLETFHACEGKVCQKSTTQSKLEGFLKSVAKVKNDKTLMYDYSLQSLVGHHQHSNYPYYWKLESNLPVLLGLNRKVNPVRWACRMSSIQDKIFLVWSSI